MNYRYRDDKAIILRDIQEVKEMTESLRTEILKSDGYIELKDEGKLKTKGGHALHRQPIQACSFIECHGVVHSRNFFAEWDSFDEAIAWLRHAHNHPIVIGDKVYFKNTNHEI